MWLILDEFREKFLQSKKQEVRNPTNEILSSMKWVYSGLQKSRLRTCFFVFIVEAEAMTFVTHCAVSKAPSFPREATATQSV